MSKFQAGMPAVNTSCIFPFYPISHADKVPLRNSTSGQEKVTRWLFLFSTKFIYRSFRHFLRKPQQLGTTPTDLETLLGHTTFSVARSGMVARQFLTELVVILCLKKKKKSFSPEKVVI